MNALTNAYGTQFPPSPGAMPATMGYPHCGLDRLKWLGPYSDDSVPDHLTSTYPFDNGLDTASLAADPMTFEMYREAGVIRDCLGYVGDFGCLALELLAQYAAAPSAKPMWFQAGT